MNELLFSDETAMSGRHIRQRWFLPTQSVPFMVFDEAKERDPTTVEDQPQVLEQIPDGQAEGRFMAEWDGQKWIVGDRID
jgi:hypothetical protein